MNRKILIMTVAGLLLASIAAAQTKVVTLKGGRKIVGEVVRGENQIEVSMKGGMTVVFQNDQVISIEDYVPPENVYEKRLAEARKKDSAEAWYDLGEWAMGKEMYAEAKDALEKALAKDATHQRAMLLLRQVKAQLAQKPREPENGKTDDGEDTTADKLGKIRKKWLIDEKAIQRIRLEELRKDDRVQIEFKDDVIDRFIDGMRGTGDFANQGFENRFRGGSPLAKTRYILDHIDRNNTGVKDDIIIKSDPKFMRTFRSKIWPALRQNCATADCHGGDKAPGGFKVFVHRGRNERVDYTNFLLVDGYVSNGRRLIDRNNPDESLLLHYGLPRKLARYKHPEPRTRHIFPRRNNAKFKLFKEWITELQGPLHPDYRLDYKPPKGIKFDISGKPAFLGGGGDDDDEPATQPDATP